MSYTASTPSDHPTDGRQSAKDLAYEHVKHGILDGSLGSGEFLTEEGIAGALGISRTPIREAFLRLEAEDLLQLVPRKGAFVRPITAREVSEVMQVRSLVETFAAERALTQAGGGAEIARALSALRDEQAALAARSDSAAFIDCDRRFHLEIVSAPRNQVLIDLYQRLRDQQLRMGVHAVLDDAGRLEQVLAEHTRIVEAFAAGDVDAVRDAIAHHLGETARVLRTRIEGL